MSENPFPTLIQFTIDAILEGGKIIGFEKPKEERFDEL